MPYNTSRGVVVRMEQFLITLDESRGTVDFKTKDPKRLAYNLRESIYASAYHADFKKYAALRLVFRLHIIEPTILRARYIPVGEPIRAIVRDISPKKEKGRRGPRRRLVTLPGQDPIPIMSEADAHFAGEEVVESLKGTTVQSVVDLAGIIGAMMHYGRTLEVYFPDARLDENQLGRLYRWATGFKWKLIEHDGVGVTLSRRADTPEEITWKPKGET